MAQNSFALMTNLGRAKEAAALANGTAIVITHIAIGDGTTVPSGGETALYHEVARKAISGHGTVAGASNVAYFDIFLAAAEGPYTIREAGLYDDAGDLIAIARYDPPINKPVPASGQTVEGTVRLEVAFSNIATVTIVVDPAFTVPLQRLSRLPWIPIISMSASTPPSSPSLGSTYLVPSGASGSWAGQGGKIAEYTAAGWAILTSPDGHGVSLPDGRIFEKINGTYVEKIAQDTQSGRWTYAVAGGSANALTATLTPAPTVLVAGMVICIKVTTKNTGPVTLNVNGIGASPIVTMKGTPLLKGDLIDGSVVPLIYNGNSWTVPGIVFGEIRQVLQNDLTLWIRTDGSDNNDGSANTAANAFKTIQGCWDYIANRYEGGGKTITMALGMPGTYDGFAASSFSGAIVIQGDVSPSDNYIIRCRSGNTIGEVVTSSISNLSIINCVLSFTYTGADADEWILGVRGGGQITAVGCRYRMTSNRQFMVINSIDSGCIISVRGQTQIQGSFLCSHFVQVLGGGIFLGGVANSPANINLAAGQTYNNYFCQASLGGVANWAQATFSGSTNPVAIRFLVNLNGIINTNGGGANFLPGTALGVTDASSGGIYA